MKKNSSPCIDWTHLSQEWPEIIYLRKVGDLPNFPWNQKSFRNFCCGIKADPQLKAEKFYIGRFVALKKESLVSFLNHII